MTVEMPRIDLVIFDLDGTLVDSAPDIAAALRATLRDAGLPVPPLERVKSMVGDGARILIQRALAEAGAVDGRGWADGALHGPLPPGALRRLAPVPGVTEALDRLAAAAIPAAVVTNKPGDLARPLLEQLGIADRLIGDRRRR